MVSAMVPSYESKKISEDKDDTGSAVEVDLLDEDGRQNPSVALAASNRWATAGSSTIRVTDIHEEQVIVRSNRFRTRRSTHAAAMLFEEIFDLLRLYLGVAAVTVCMSRRRSTIFLLSP